MSTTSGSGSRVSTALPKSEEPAAAGAAGSGRGERGHHEAGGRHAGDVLEAGIPDQDPAVLLPQHLAAAGEVGDGGALTQPGQGVPHPLDRRVEHGRAEAQARGVGLDHSGRADREHGLLVLGDHGHAARFAAARSGAVRPVDARQGLRLGGSRCDRGQYEDRTQHGSGSNATSALQQADGRRAARSMSFR
jgi:hypothetical protein